MRSSRGRGLTFRVQGSGFRALMLGVGSLCVGTRTQPHMYIYIYIHMCGAIFE